MLLLLEIAFVFNLVFIVMLVVKYFFFPSPIHRADDAEQIKALVEWHQRKNKLSAAA